MCTDSTTMFLSTDMPEIEEDPDAENDSGQASLTCTRQTSHPSRTWLVAALLLTAVLAILALHSFSRPQKTHIEQLHRQVDRAIVKLLENSTVQCSDNEKDCTWSHCCTQVGAQCYEKNENWAQCLSSCAPGLHPGDLNNESWSCRPLGSRFSGRKPSLFCFSVMQTGGYEPNLMREQVHYGAGIFACNEYTVFTQKTVVSLGVLTKDDVSEEVKTTRIVNADNVVVGVSGQGTAVNAYLFMLVWQTILEDGSFRNHDWAVKADPDAVVLPWRLQEHLTPHTARVPEEVGSYYVVNCNKYPSNPNFPMMYGAVEVFSSKALEVYAKGNARCLSTLPWKDWQWGEDKFMGKCVGLLGVNRLEDYHQVGDKECTYSGCADSSRAAYHSFKDGQSWLNCWGEATAPTDSLE